MFMYIPPLFLKVKNQTLQNELNDANIFKADFSQWATHIDTNIHCIIALTLLGLSILFLIGGLLLHYKRKRER